MVVGFMGADSQNLKIILGPFGAKFDVLGPDRNFGQDLTSPVLLFRIDKPCAAGYYSRRGFFSRENDHPGISTLAFWGLAVIL